MSKALSRLLRWSFTLVAICVIGYFGASLCARGINLSDEGYLLSQALDMLAGKVLYRDMDAFVTPGIWFVLAGLFQIVDPSVFATRFVALAAYLAAALLTFRIARRLTSWIWAWGAVGLYCVMSVWAFPAWTVVFYSCVATLFALAAIDLLLTWRVARRPFVLLLCGMAVGLCVAFKQNYGAFVLVGCLLGAIAIRVESGEAPRTLWRAGIGDGIRLGAGVAAVAAPILVYFGIHGALDEMFELLVIHPFFFAGRQSISFPALSLLWADAPLAGVDGLTYGSYFLWQAPYPFSSVAPLASWLSNASALRRLHVLLYWLPMLGLAVGLWLVFRPLPGRRPIDGGLAALLAVASLLFLGVFPRADFNHLINVYQPTLIAGVVLAHRASERLGAGRLGLPRLGLAFGTALLLPVTAIAMNWYVHAYRAMNKRLTIPRAQVLVNARQQRIIEFHLEAIRERTADGEPLLTVPALTMLNFLADRHMPGRYYNLYEHHIAGDGGAAVVEAAEAAGVRLVVADYNNFFSDRVGLRFYAPELAAYLRTHFEPEFDVAGTRYQYLRRRPAPIREGERIDLLSHCEWDPESATYTSEHLRFASLYQARDPLRPHVTLDATCTFRVPERTELVFSLGQRNPWAASRGASFHAEVRVANGANDETLFADTMTVELPEGMTQPSPPVRRVDLSRFAGREITLVLRSRLEGFSRASGFGLEGVALVWQDPHLEVGVHHRALLVGIDGATFRVIEPLMAAGRMPNLRAIAAAGASGSLRSEPRPLSPRIWGTIATGKAPHEHGITGFVTSTEGGGKRLLLGTDRKVPAIWNIASNHGVTTAVVNWLNSYPPEVVQGVIVSDFAIADERMEREKFFAGNDQAVGRVGEAVTHPPEWAEVVEALARDTSDPIVPANPLSEIEALPSWMNLEILKRSFSQDGLVARMALEAEERVRPDLLMVYLPGIDRVSHLLWGSLEPAASYPPELQFTDEERRASRTTLEGYYVYVDQLLGELVDRFGEGDLVMVLSDHGFEALPSNNGLTGGHESKAARDGVLFMRGGGIAAGSKAIGTTIYDITPTLLTWLDLPVGRDMGGRVLPFLGLPASRTVASHDGTPIERAASAKPEIENEILDQLRGLGYVE